MSDDLEHLTQNEDGELGFYKWLGNQLLFVSIEKPGANRTCRWCGVPITPENDSGWEVFITATETQPECKACYGNRAKKPTRIVDGNKPLDG